jgi:hypothetical protein
MSTFPRIENNDEREGSRSPDKHKEDKKLQWVLVRLKTTMQHFEAALQKIKRTTTAINNPSLV